MTVYVYTFICVEIKTNTETVTLRMFQKVQIILRCACPIFFLLTVPTDLWVMTGLLSKSSELLTYVLTYLFTFPPTMLRCSMFEGLRLTLVSNCWTTTRWYLDRLMWDMFVLLILTSSSNSITATLATNVDVALERPSKVTLTGLLGSTTKCNLALIVTTVSGCNLFESTAVWNQGTGTQTKRYKRADVLPLERGANTPCHKTVEPQNAS